MAEEIIIEMIKNSHQKPFEEQIIFNLEQLNYRFSRLSEIDTTKESNKKEYLMIFDSFIALFRALFLEKGQEQYSVQNYYRVKGKDEIVKNIDDYLNSKIFSWCDKSIRDVLKFIADKFVCHIDPISRKDLATANFYMSHLSNPYTNNNLREIIENISQIMNKF